jgi:NAD(P)-dependent dehydrogenase (short-subunit alcohol dehydrogenase family)
MRFTISSLGPGANAPPCTGAHHRPVVVWIAVSARPKAVRSRRHNAIDSIWRAGAKSFSVMPPALCVDLAVAPRAAAVFLASPAAAFLTGQMIFVGGGGVM